MKWDVKTFEAVRDYLRTQKYPDDIITASQQHAWRKRCDIFSVDPDGNLVLVVHEVPPWAQDKDGKPLFQVRLPFTVDHACGPGSGSERRTDTVLE